jgi:hypothetical protein
MAFVIFAESRTLLEAGDRTESMLHELVTDPGELTPTELYNRYISEIRTVLNEHGIETVAESSGVDPATLRELSEGGSPELTLEESAAILATSDDSLDGETIVTIARDELLMGMTTAVLDVEAVESGLSGDLEAREIQAKVEGRFPMTLREFALLYQYIDGER